MRVNKGAYLLKVVINYLPKCWKVLFSKPRFIEIFVSSSEGLASAEIVELNRGLEIVLLNTLGK